MILTLSLLLLWKMPYKRSILFTKEKKIGSILTFSQDSIAKTTIKAGKFFNNQPYVVVHIDDRIIESLVEDVQNRKKTVTF